jgi:hypothetical protein
VRVNAIREPSGDQAGSVEPRMPASPSAWVSLVASWPSAVMTKISKCPKGSSGTNRVKAIFLPSGDHDGWASWVTGKRGGSSDLRSVPSAFTTAM